MPSRDRFDPGAKLRLVGGVEKHSLGGTGRQSHPDQRHSFARAHHHQVLNGCCVRVGNREDPESCLKALNEGLSRG